jgi:hypothetical protein
VSDTPGVLSGEGGCRRATHRVADETASFDLGGLENRFELLDVVFD